MGQEPNGTSEIAISKNQFFGLFATFEFKLDQCVSVVLHHNQNSTHKSESETKVDRQEV